MRMTVLKSAATLERTMPSICYGRLEGQRWAAALKCPVSLDNAKDSALTI